MKKAIVLISLAFVSAFANAQLKVYSSGKVFIGGTGTTPTHLLDVRSSGTSTGGFTGIANSDGTKYIGMYNGADANENQAIFWTSSQDLKFGISTSYTTAGWAELVRIKSNGNVGIGLTSPQTKLDVNAGSSYDGIRCQVSHSTDYGYGINSYVSRSLTKALAVQLSGTDKFTVSGAGDVWAKSVTTWSDKTLKENIVTITGALSKVLQLQGYTYNFKPADTTEINPEKQMGLLAQDVESILPEVVSTSDKGLKGIAYDNLVALLIEAIKEQDKKMAQLRSDLDSCCAKPSQNKLMDQGGHGSNDKESTLQIELANTNNFFLYQNEPNPFTGSTVIRYFIPENAAGAIYMVFYDMYGKEVNKIEVKEKGFGKIEANTENLAQGIYSYSIIVNDKTIETKKMMRTK